MQYLRFLMVWGLLSVASLPALAEVRVFACEPEWAALAEELGGDHVTIKTATTALADPHHIRAKPSLIAAIRRSELVVCSGNDLEVGWLPILLEKAKPSVQPGQVGHVLAADYVKILEIPEVIDRSHGDVHPGGNPHVHLNPHNLIPVAQEITQRLRQIDAPNANFYQKQLELFLQRWQHAIARWEQKAQPLQGMPIVVHHKNWVYLIDWLGLRQVGTLEPKPGIPPSASHLQSLLSTLQHKPANLVIHAPYEDDTAAQWLSGKAGIAVVELPYTVGGSDAAKDLFTLFDQTIEQLLGAR